MDFKHIIKEARYYTRLDGSPKRAISKFLFSKTPLSKLVNTKSYNYFYKKRIEKFTKQHKPTILQIENSNLCNARCIMCPHNKMKRKMKVMQFNDFKKIIDDCLKSYKSIKMLTLTGFGEPFTDTGIIEKIKYVDENYPRILIDIYTNASLVNKDMTGKLLGRKIHKINFSINAMESNYNKITGLDYNKVRENILYFVNKKRNMKKEFPLINFSLMILKENEKDIERFIKLWMPYGDSVMTYLPLDWAGNKKIETVDLPVSKKKRWACIPLWQSITIDANGDVIMCCQDYESKVKFGNALKTDIKEIMNSRKFQALREMHKSGNFSSEICNTCDNWYNSSLWWWVYI